jgi:carbon storage regulator
MLILTRKSQEAVVITGTDNVEQLLKVTVLEVRGGRVKLAFEAGEEVPIYRHEVWERIRAEQQRPDAKPIAPRPIVQSNHLFNAKEE